MVVFLSKWHPKDASPALVFARSHVRPIGVCLLPVMIVASLNVLSTTDPLRFLIWSVPLAYLVATAWTWFFLLRTLAEIHVTDTAARIRTVWDVARNRPGTPWQPVLGVRLTGHSVLASIGYTVVELHPHDWPDLDAIEPALRRAARAPYAVAPDAPGSPRDVPSA